MSRQLPNLNALRAFDAAARHLSFTKAADELCVTPGAISRHIRALEAELSITLFRRLTRAVELTREGAEYFQTARQAFDVLEQAHSAATEHNHRRVLTVSTLPTFGMRWLIPRLPRYTLIDPRTEVHLVTTIAPASFAREPIDLAIRVGRVPATTEENQGPRIDLEMVDDWAGIEAELLMTDVLVPVCSPALIGWTGRQIEPSELISYPLLTMATRARAWPDWLRFCGLEMPQGGATSPYGHFFAVAQAAIEGKGIALIPRQLIAAEIADGKLVVPTDRTVESDGAYYVLGRTKNRDTRPIRQFRQWLVEEARRVD